MQRLRGVNIFKDITEELRYAEILARGAKICRD